MRPMTLQLKPPRYLAKCYANKHFMTRNTLYYINSYNCDASDANLSQYREEFDEDPLDLLVNHSPAFSPIKRYKAFTM